MALWVNSDAVKAARVSDLYEFLLRCHPGDVKKEGNSLRLRSNNSVSVKAGYSGYTDFATGEKGNSVDFLTKYLGYDFQDAVQALCHALNLDIGPRMDAASKQQGQDAAPKTFILPEPEKGRYSRTFAYLSRQRGIPPQTIQQLIDWGLLYQDAAHGNMVFINPEKTFAELRGTVSYKPYHQVMFSDPAAFWWYKPHGPDSIATVAYVCESAIDAVSLHLLQTSGAVQGLPKMGPDDNALYCSIGGVANQQRIDYIKAGMAAAGCKTIIAVDNDKAGEDCRCRNQDCPATIPTSKDWNEDLCNHFLL